MWFPCYIVLPKHNIYKKQEQTVKPVILKKSHNWHIKLERNQSFVRALLLLACTAVLLGLNIVKWVSIVLTSLLTCISHITPLELHEFHSKNACENRRNTLSREFEWTASSVRHFGMNSIYKGKCSRCRAFDWLDLPLEYCMLVCQRMMSDSSCCPHRPLLLS